MRLRGFAAVGRAELFRAAMVLTALVVVRAATAGPFIPPGDAALRADIAVLADYGVLEGPVTTWPLAWGPLLADLEDALGAGELPPIVSQALARVLSAADEQAGTGNLRINVALAGAENPSRIRSFPATPRDSAEVGAGIAWTGDRFTIQLNGNLVQAPDDRQDGRADGSVIGVALGNFAFAASTLDRWWGPGWDGSLILSSNARPIPALTLDRTFTDAFESNWLRWLGPWDVSVLMGQMEAERAVPDTRFFGMRFNFRPLSSLEIGLTRTAQWCGEGRPCGFDTFADLLAGRDNVGDDGIATGNEPGNQMAGIDFRWSLRQLSLPIAVYGQFIGEDEAGGFPSRYLGQLGVEGAELWGENWSHRWFAEFSDTSCGFYKMDANFDCAYNHSIYRDGYRYRGRAIGHGADNDTRLLSVGLMLADDVVTRWRFLARVGELNRGGRPDSGHTLAPVAEDIASVDVAWSRDFEFGVIELAAGAERTGETDFRGYLQWRSSL